MNKKMPTILVIGARGIPDAEGGAEKNAEALFPRLAARGYEVTLMGLSTYIRSDSHQGVRLRAAPDIRVLNTDKLAYYLAAIVESRRLRPDIVHLQGLGAALFLWPHKLMGRRIVVRYGSADYTVAKWGFLGRLGFLLGEWQLRYADAVVSVTPSLSRRLAEKGITANVHLIPNALDAPLPPTRRARTHERPYLLMVGRVTGQKNVTTLLSAFALFSARHPRYDLLIAGGLDDVAYVKALSALCSERTRFLGRVPRSAVPDLLRGAALFVNVSLHEGHSNATLEAISHDKPILLSAIPENLDIGLPAHIHVDPLDPEAIARGMADALADPHRFIPDKTRFLSWDQVSEKTAALYDAVLEKGHDQPRRIVFLINSLAGGGAERVMATLLTHSRPFQRRYDHHLILLDLEEEAYGIPPFVTLHRLDGRGQLLRSLARAALLLRQLTPDTVISFLTRANSINILTRPLSGHRAILSERAQTSGHHGAGLPAAARRLLLRFLYPRAHRMIAVSKGVGEDLVSRFSVRPERLVTIPNPIDKDSIAAQAALAPKFLPPGPFVAGMGRLVPSKNFSLLIKAFARSRFPGHLVIIGKGPEKTALEALSRTLGIEGRVHFPGFLDNPFPLLAAASAYVLSSNGEGFPNSLVEAMTLGCPVIATNCRSGPSEILDDEAHVAVTGVHAARYGILVPPGAVEPMAEAIALIADPLERKALSDRARKGAERYGLAAAVEAYWRVIEDEAGR